MRKTYYYITFKNGKTTALQAWNFTEAFVLAMYEQYKKEGWIDIELMEDEYENMVYNPIVIQGKLK